MSCFTTSRPCDTKDVSEDAGYWVIESHNSRCSSRVMVDVQAAKASAKLLRSSSRDLYTAKSSRWSAYRCTCENATDAYCC
jgi:hypothetical protein